MKSVYSILLAIAVLAATTGFMQKKHFCGERVISNKIVFSHSHTSCCGDMEMPAGCCKDEYTYHKSDQDLVVSIFNVDILPDFAALEYPVALQMGANRILHTPVQYFNFHPPPITASDNRVLLQSFLL